MKTYALILVAALAVACGDDESSDANNTANNSNNTSTNNSNNTSTNNSNNTSTNNSNNTANNSNNASTNNSNNTSTNNEVVTPLPDPFVSQLIFRRIATENCVLSGCIKSEGVNFVSHVILNQDGRQTLLPQDDGDYQALRVEAQRAAFMEAMKSGFGCSDSVTGDGTSYEFEASIRENGSSSTKFADITGCVVDADEKTQLVLDLFGNLKTTYLP